MPTQRIISWNVNGIRAIAGKGGLDWIAERRPDVFCLQETKAHPDQLDESILHRKRYHGYWASAQKKGYSGVCVFSRKEPNDVRFMEVDDFDNEGRVLVVDFDAYTLINAYFPNSQAKGKRIDYKVAFCDAMLELCNRLTAEGKHIVLCGDYNIAHKPIDLARPKENEKNPGYLPEERAWMDTFTDQGYVDAFRQVCDEPDHYTWWSYRTNARERNIGWRIDYHCVDAGLAEAVRGVNIQNQVMGSDHCPVELTLGL